MAIRLVLIEPWDKAPHSLLILCILGELFSQNAFFSTCFGREERAERQRCEKRRRASPYQRPSHGAAKHGRGERVTNQSVNSVPHKAAVWCRLGERREIAPQGNCAGHPTYGSEQQKNGPGEYDWKSGPILPEINRKTNDREQERTLTKDPYATSLYESTAHLVGRFNCIRSAGHFNNSFCPISLCRGKFRLRCRLIVPWLSATGQQGENDRQCCEQLRGNRYGAKRRFEVHLVSL